MDLAVETAGLDEADLQPVSGLAESGEHGVVALCERNVTFASFLVPLQSAPSTGAIGGMRAGRADSCKLGWRSLFARGPVLTDRRKRLVL
jgi:hypothetical protein